MLRMDRRLILNFDWTLFAIVLLLSGIGLLNIYSVMTVYNTNQPLEKIQMANNFVNFLIDPATQADIGSFGVDKYGKALFIPMTVEVPTATAGWVGDYSTPATDLKPAPVATTAAPAANATAVSVVAAK